jgi:hypothetical protein
MKVILDTEFTQLNASAKLISLALVAEDGRELYIELTDSYALQDCSTFVIEHVIPQLDLATYGCTTDEGRSKLARFIAGAGDVEICSDAPDRDWKFLSDLLRVDGQWPANVLDRPLNLIEMYNEKGSHGGEIDLPDPPHHALLDARILASLYNSAIA